MEKRDGLKSSVRLEPQLGNSWNPRPLRIIARPQPKEIATFLELFSDFDNSDGTDNHNGQLIVLDLKLQGKDEKTANALDFRESWERVKDAGLRVKRKKSTLQQGAQQEAKWAADAIRAGEAIPDEGELYRMPHHELCRRASGIR